MRDPGYIAFANEGNPLGMNRETRKEAIMQTSMTQIQDPARARSYFEQKIAFTTGPVELDRLIKSRDNHVAIVDVREAEDYAKGHIPGAINLPKGTWENPNGLSKDKTNVVYCYSQVCHLAANACVAFASKGFPVMELEGGFETWKDYELDIEHDPVNRMKGTSPQQRR
jgi:rhodanese-related sulfurtransferase